EFTTTTAADGNGNGVYSAEIDGKSVTFTVTDADKKASLITSETVYKNSASLYTTTKVDNKAATLSDLDLNAAKKTGSTLVVNGATYDVSADGKTITETASGNNKVMYLSKSEG
ncbi:flagellin, partial [Escherichia coli]